MKFKVGDRVQFKSWEEMEKEFGANKGGSINCRLGFLTEMKCLCGTFATIYNICQDRVYLNDFSVKDDEILLGEHGVNFWIYSADMLKPAKDGKKYRVGDKVQYNGSTYVCDGACSRKEDTDKYELHIMSDGKKTTAVYKKNGEIVSRSEANLHPDDEFNFKTGAAIAFDRVFQPEPEKKEPKKLLRLFSFAGNCYGTVGTPTKYKDVYGRPLFVGDIVEIENAFFAFEFVVEDKYGAYVMGIKECCDPKKGTIRDWKVKLITPFTEVEEGKEHQAYTLTPVLK